MRTSSLFAALSLLASTAHAQSLTEHPDFVLEAVTGTFFEEGGPGAPSPGYDPVNGEYVMIFESPYDPADAACPAGRWALGMATSPDGINWTASPDALFLPAPDTYYGCIAAPPALLIANDTRLWHLWFKAHQESTNCDDPSDLPPWGCPETFTYTSGIGHAVSDDQGATWTLSDEPIVPFGLLGFPNASKIDGEFRLFFSAAEPNLPDYRMYYVTSPDAETYSTPKPVASPGFAPRAQDQLTDISAQCRNEERPFVNWVVGQRFGANRFTITQAGLFAGDARTGGDWEWDTDPYLPHEPAADPASRFIHQDAIRFEDEFGEENWAIYRTLLRGGKRVVQLAYTWPTAQTALPTANVQSRVCVSETFTGGDTDPPPGCPPDGFVTPPSGDPVLPVLDATTDYTTNGYVDGSFYEGKVDRFEVEVPTDCTLSASITFAHEDPPVSVTSGDLDLAVSQDGEEDFLVVSDSVDNDESLELTNEDPTTATWVVEVLPFAAECTPYDLTLSLDCPEDTDPGVDTDDTDPGVDTDDTGDTEDTEDTGDTGDTEDTGDTSDTEDTGDSADTSDTADSDSDDTNGDGCACSTRSAPATGWWALFLGLPLALRRRRTTRRG